MNIKRPELIIEQVIDSVNLWYNFAKEYEIPNDTIKQIGNTLQLSNF